MARMVFYVLSLGSLLCAIGIAGSGSDQLLPLAALAAVLSFVMGEIVSLPRELLRMRRRRRVVRIVS